MKIKIPLFILKTQTKLTIKILLAITGLLLIAFSCLVTSLVSDQEKLLTSQLEKEGQLYVESISSALVDSVIIDDYPVIESAISRLRDKYPEKLVKIEVFKRGVILASSGNTKGYMSSELYRVENPIYAHDYLDEEKWREGKTIAWISKRSLKEILKDTRNTIIANIAAVFIPLYFILFILLQRSITTPLKKLLYFTKKISKGDLNEKIVIETNDEFGNLGRSFNAMIDSIELSHTNLVQTEKLASLGELSAGLAHELNNPLMSIMGYNTMIKRKLVKEYPLALEHITKNIEKIDSATVRMKTIIDHFCEFSRKSEHITSKTCIKKCIENSFSLLAIQLQQLDIYVEQIYPLGDVDDDYFVLGDTNRLEQVFINIIANARDALEKQEMSANKKLSVTIKKEGKALNILFTDNGIGMNKSTLGRIFDPFYTTKEIGQGTGLGLSISHGIIIEHGGKLTAKSTLGSSTTFSIKLPIFN